MFHSVTQYLRASSKKYPEHPAFVDNKITLTHCELLLETEKIAYALVKEGLFKKPIAVMMDKSARNLVAFLGVALSGNYYTAIDTRMPKKRVERILETFDPAFMIIDKHNIKKAKELGRAFLVIDDILNFVLSEDDKRQVERSESRIIDTDILYVLFTSGSSGIPKGVIITHRSVIDYIEWVAKTFQLDHSTVLGNQAPFYFDNSVFDIYSTLRNGATLYIIPQSLFMFPIRLLEYLRDNQINTILWVPTMLSRIADLQVLDKCEIDCLKKVLFLGEVMPARQLNVWISRLPDAVFANLYGPTETTVACTCYIVDRKIEDDEPVPIGYPCANTDILVLNDEDQLAEVNQKGELCVRGSSLSLGYYNNPEKTAEAFVQNPLNSLYHELIYRTGDIVHYNERGEIIYDGRRDFQIKHSGHRIELGEIEIAAFSNANVKSCCCMHDTKADKLILFYVGDIVESDLKKYLIGYVPEYMVPSDYQKLEEMPLNMNGKIDRVELKQRIIAL